MSLEFAHGSQLWASADAATTVYTISGLSFQPKAFMFVSMGLSSATDAASEATSARLSIGFATRTTDRRCQGFLSVDGAAAGDCQEVYRDDAVVATVAATPAGFVDGLLDLDSVTSDGFTLIVNDAAPVDLMVFWFVWGGDDIVNAATGEINEPAATGNQSYSVVNWLATVLGDNAVLFAGCQLTVGAPTAAAQDAGFMFGAATATGAGNQFVVASNEDDGSATMDTDGYVRGDECLAMMAVAGGNPNARASFNGFDSLGFDLNWVARAVTNRRYIYLAIQGGSWNVGNYTLALGTVGNTATVSGLKFRPKGGLGASSDRVESTAGTSTAEAKQIIGGWSSTSARRAMAYWSEHSTGNTEIDLAIEYDGMLCFPTNAGAIDWVVDIDAINADGFRVIVDDARAVALTDFQNFVTFGDAPRPAAFFPDVLLMGQKVAATGMRPPGLIE